MVTYVHKDLASIADEFEKKAIDLRTRAQSTLLKRQKANAAYLAREAYTWEAAAGYLRDTTLFEFDGPPDDGFDPCPAPQLPDYHPERVLALFTTHGYGPDGNLRPSATNAEWLTVPEGLDFEAFAQRIRDSARTTHHVTITVEFVRIPVR